MELDLVKVLADAMVASDEDQGVRVRPSSLGLALGHEHDGCQLEFYLGAKGAKRRRPTPGEMLMFQAGHLMEAYVVEVLRKALPAYGYRILGTQTESKAFGIQGSLDIEVEHIETGARYIVDVKTKRGNAFRYLDKAKPGNVLQVQFYTAARDAAGGALIYLDREGQNFGVQFPVERADHRPEKAVKVLNALLKKKTPPSPVPPKVNVRKNKGADSVYLDEPWQWGWCRLQTCACKQEYGSLPLGAMVCKVGNPGKDGKRPVEFVTPVPHPWNLWVVAEVQNHYDEELVL